MVSVYSSAGTIRFVWDTKMPPMPNAPSAVRDAIDEKHRDDDAPRHPRAAPHAAFYRLRGPLPPGLSHA